jgi:hypothetical protein
MTVHEIRPVTIEIRSYDSWEPIERANTGAIALTRAWLCGHRTFRLTDRYGVIVTVVDSRIVEECE